MARKSAFAVIVLFLFTFQKVSAVSQANGELTSSLVLLSVTFQRTVFVADDTTMDEKVDD